MESIRSCCVFSNTKGIIMSSITVKVGSWLLVGAAASIGAMAINTTPAVADTAYDNGLKAGSSAAKRMWEEIYHGQCARVGDFDTQATNDLIQGAFNGSGSYNQGGRAGVQKVIDWTHEQCPDVAMCKTEGDEAAAQVAAIFCSLGVIEATVHHDICIQIAGGQCQSSVLDKIEKMANHGHCSFISNNIKNVTNAETDWMMDSCTKIVKDRIPEPPPAP